jgi:hypothetical protein
MLNQAFEVDARVYAAGEIVPLAYGNALVLAAGDCGSIVDANSVHLQAQESLAVYGGDSWFPHPQQTISRVAEYLAQANPGQPANN